MSDSEDEAALWDGEGGGEGEGLAGDGNVKLLWHERGLVFGGKVRGCLGVGCKILGIGCWKDVRVLGIRCWVLGSERWVLGIGRRVFGVGYWVSSIGCSVLRVACCVARRTGVGNGVGVARLRVGVSA